MSQLKFNKIVEPSTPAANKTIVYMDTADNHVKAKDYTGTVTDLAAGGGSGTVTHTAGALTANQLVIGAGAADTAALGSLGTTATVLHGNAAGAPTFAAVAESEVTNLVTDLAAKAPLASPTFTGTPAAPTAAAATNTTQIATTAFVRANIVAPRVTSVASSATPAPNADTDDLYDLTALAAAAAFTNPSGTPVNGQKLLIRIKDNATARALTWGSAYVAGGVALPSTTVLSKILTLGFIYNTANALNKWQLIASAQEA